ncbi:MAG: hypothetical protein JWP39_1619 [Jatrophihabitans sp.]|nr:hypothetical protein [Jatrophihabitans sp.]
MTTPPEPENGSSEPQMDLTKNEPTAEAPFDPYRFGKPDHPIPPEYAPPGYVPPPSPAPPAGGPPMTPYPGMPQPGPQQPYDPANSPYPYGAPPYGNAPYGNTPYGNTPYGAPPPNYHSYVQPKTGNGKSVTALVLGILSIVMFWTSIFDGVLVIIALIFGFIGLSEANSRRTSGKGMAIAGLICAAVGAVLAIIWTIYILNAVNKCGGFSQNNSSSFQQCVQDHI